MAMKTATFSGTLKFRDGEEATTLLELTSSRIKLTTTAKDVVNREVWNRSHVARLRVFAARPGQWMPRLLLKDGKEVTLGVIMTEVEADTLASVF